LIHAEGWWARYAPQLYFIPVIIGLLLVSVREKVANVVGLVAVAALTLNLAMVGGSYLYRNIKATYMMNNQLEQFARAKGAIEVYFGRHFRPIGVRFSEAEISYREIRGQEGLSCARPIPIVHAERALVCL
jgi:hypothetical protein